jgi:hypothetical protein
MGLYTKDALSTTKQTAPEGFGGGFALGIHRGGNPETVIDLSEKYSNITKAHLFDYSNNINAYKKFSCWSVD